MPFLAISLQVNNVQVKYMTCAQLVPVIAQSGLQLELVVTRNPTASSTDSAKPCSNDACRPPQQQTVSERQHSEGAFVENGSQTTARSPSGRTDPPI